MNPDELIKKLRASGRFVFSYKISDEEKELPEAHLKARIKMHFSKTIDSYFQDDSLPVARFNSEPERY